MSASRPSPLGTINYDRYLRQPTGDFIGREWLLGKLADWLGRPDGRFCLVTGEPGSGKTAIAAQLLARSQGRIVDETWKTIFPTGFLAAAHFCRVENSDSLSPYVFGRSLATQLADRHPEYAQALVNSVGQGRIEVHGSATAGTVTGANANVIGVVINRLEAGGLPAEEAFRQLVTEPTDLLYRRGFADDLILLVDALDESLLYSGPVGIADLLIHLRTLPSRVRVIVTARPDADLLRSLGGDDMEKIDLTTDGLVQSLADVERYARRRLEQDSEITKRLSEDLSTGSLAIAISRRSAGNFLYTDKLLDALGLDPEGRITRESLEQFPVGLDGLYIEFLNRILGNGKAERWRIDAPIAGTLAIARAPLTEQQLSRFTQRAKSEIREVLRGDLQQFLEVDESLPASTRQYALYHRSFAEFLLDEDRAEEYWCEPQEQHRGVVAAYLDQEQVDWSACDDYGLRHLPAHVLGMGEEQRFFDLLTGPFLSAKAERFSYRNALDDLLTGTLVASRRHDLGSMLRLQIARHSLKQFVGALPSQLAERMITIYAVTGRVSRAVDLAHLIDTDWQRPTVLRAIVGVLAYKDLDEAAEVAEQISDPQARVEAFTMILRAQAGHRPLPPGIDEAAERLLAMIEQNTPDSTWGLYWRSGRIQFIAETLGLIGSTQYESTLERAVEAARTIPEPQWRYEHLHGAAVLVSRTDGPRAISLYEEALTALYLMPDQDWPANQLGEIVGKVAALDPERAARLVARVPTVVGRPFALAHLAHHLAATDRVAAAAHAAEAVQAASLIPGLGKAEAPGWQETALERIAWAFASYDLDAASAFVERELPRGIARDNALAQIAKDPGHPVPPVLPLARQIHDERLRGEVFEALARRQTPDDVDAAIQLTAEIPDIAQRCRTMRDIAVWLLDRKDPRAEPLLDELEELAESVPSGRATLLAEVSAGLGLRDPQRTATLRTRALQTDAASDPSDRAEADTIVAWERVGNGDPATALEVIRRGLKAAFSVQDQYWVQKSRAYLLSELARRDWNQAHLRLSALPDDIRQIVLLHVVAALAEVDSNRATQLFEEYSAMPSQPSKEFSALETRALGALLVAAARNGSHNTWSLAERLWPKGEDYAHDLKSTALATASSVLADTDLDGALRLLGIVVKKNYYYGDCTELGRAVAAILRRDVRRGTELAWQAVSWTKDQARVVLLCKEVADIASELALELSNSITEVYGSADIAGALRGDIQARIAAAFADSNRPRAESLLQQAHELADHSPFAWPRADVLLESAQTRSTWDVAGAQHLVNEALLLCGDQGSRGLAGTIPAGAAVAMIKAGEEQQARSLMEQAIKALHGPAIDGWSQEDIFDAIRSGIATFPQELRSNLLLTLIYNVLEEGDLLFRQPTRVVPLLLQAEPSDGPDVPVALLREINAGLDVAGDIFVA